MEERMTIEQMLVKSSEARKAAKALQRKLQDITEPEERKQLARQMNDLFAQASTLRNEAKQQHYFEQSAEREFISLKASLDD